MENSVFQFKGHCLGCQSEVEFVSVSPYQVCYECERKLVLRPRYEWTWTVDFVQQKAEPEAEAKLELKKEKEKKKKMRRPIRVGNRAVWSMG